jgi:hypothetical protein
MEAICSSEMSVDFNGLHGVISQKMVLFITTAVRASNPTSSERGWKLSNTMFVAVRKFVGRILSANAVDVNASE